MDFLQRHRRVYLDAAAAMPPTRRAVKAFERALRESGNPHSPHEEGRAAHALLSAARARIAGLCEVQPDAVIYTGTATEATALAIEGHIESLHKGGRTYEDMHVLYAPGAHASLTHTVEKLQTLGVSIETLSYAHADIDLKALAMSVKPTTVLVALPAVCGETGAIFSVRDVRRVLDKQHSSAALFVDACQLPLVGAYELTRLGATMIVLDAQKVGGIRGIGALIAPSRVGIEPLYEGGGQERGIRPGTPSPALAIAFAEALEEAARSRETFVAHAFSLRALLLKRLSSLARVTVNEGKQQAPHILSLSFIGRDTDYLSALLDEAGFAVSTRSACETDAEGSRAVLAITSDIERARCTLRISFAKDTTRAEVEAFSRALIRSVNFLDSAGIL